MLPAERKQMPSARPRHFPSLSEGAERFAGSRGCGIRSCPGRASPHHPGYFVLEGEARQGASTHMPGLLGDSSLLYSSLPGRQEQGVLSPAPRPQNLQLLTRGGSRPPAQP